MDRYVFVLAIICDSAFSSPFTSKQYRTDYVYNSQTDSFYKLHIEARVAEYAQRKCGTEGARLMVPESEEDLIQVHALFKKFPDLGPYVLVGTDGLQHESAEEQAMITFPTEQEPGLNLCDVVDRSGQVESMPCYRQTPFICKVNARDAPFDEQCRAFGKDYLSKISTTGSCYKISPIVYPWNEAEAECRAEGAHLVVLNSEAERQVVMDIMKGANAIGGSTTSWFFFAGIRASKPTDGTPRVFRTVLNQTLEEAGYTQWSENEPNNFLNSEYCGSLFKNDGKYNDLACSHEYAFICEKEIRVMH